MSYTNVYPSRINWENEPSIASPINATNLNKIDYALYEHDRTLETWDATKANQSDLLLTVKSIDYDPETGVFIFTWQNGTTKTVDLNIEKIPVSFSMDANGIITMTTDDGTTYTADIGALIKTYTFVDSTEIDFEVTTDQSGNKTVTAVIKNGSIAGAKLEPNYLANCQSAANSASESKNAAEGSAADAEAWAKGTRNGVPVGPTDPAYENNAKYYSEQTDPTSFNNLSDVDFSNLQSGQIPKYNSQTQKWENADDAGGLLPHLKIISDAGSTVTVTKGQTVITPEQSAGSTTMWECDIPEYGVWTIDAVLAGDDAQVTVNIDAVKIFTIDDSHFHATIAASFPQGATCRCYKDSVVYYATTNPYTFSVNSAGSWTVECTHNGVVKSQIVSITTEGQAESVNIQYAEISVTYSDEFRGLQLSCTNGSDTYTKTAPSSGNTLTFTVPTTGTWEISGTVDGTTYAESVSITTLGTSYSVTLNVYTMYGFHYDKATDTVSYQVQYSGKNVKNYSYDNAYMDFTNDTWIWGDWSIDDFFEPRPVLVSQDYGTKIYLNPNDLTKDVNGNDVTSYLTGASGSYNAMMEWGKNGRQIWYKLVPGSDPKSYTAYIADMKVDNDFHAWSFYDANDTLIDHFYTAIFGGSVVNNTLRSLSGKSRMNAVAGATEISYAKANNKNSEEYAWYIDVLADRILIDLLTILIIKGVNSDVIGYGNYTGGTGAGSLLTTGTGNTKGMFYGKQSNSVCKIFGMENWYADQWRRMAGLILSSGVQLYKLTYGTADGSSVKGYIENDNAPTNYLTGPSIATNLSASYIKGESAYTNGALLATEFGGANGTYYSDACWSATGVRFALVGGYCSRSSACGAFTLNLSVALSYTSWDVGAALSLKPLAT